MLISPCCCLRATRRTIERLVQYMTRCPFSLARLVTVNDTGQVIYKAEKDACRAFSDPQADGLESGAQRNFQILSPLEFLAEFTQHIPPKGSHLVRYYGWYSNKSRGMQRKQRDPSKSCPARLARRKRRHVQVVRVGRCQSSACTKWTHCHVRNVGARWRWWPSSNRRKPT